MVSLKDLKFLLKFRSYPLDNWPEYMCIVSATFNSVIKRSVY